MTEPLSKEQLDAIRERTWAAFAASPEFVPQACADALKLLTHIDALEAERNRLQQAVNEAWDITSEPISSEVEMHPRITQIMDALQDALSKPTLDKYNVKID